MNTEKVLDGLYRLRSNLRVICAGMHEDYHKNSIKSVDDAIQTIRELQEQNKWHLCSDCEGDLPTKDIPVLCFKENGKYCVGWLEDIEYEDGTVSERWTNTMGFGIYEVIAWRELPKFKEVE